MGRVTRLCLWLTVGVLLSSCILQGPTFSHAEEVATATPVSPSEVDLALEKAGEKFQFQAEVSRLMDIIINSLYKSKEIFLRELISNASDALDKIRFLAIGKEDEVLGDNKELKIEIKGDKEAKVLTIRDTGVGMTRQDLITNLGTVAKSGTASFIEKLTEGADLSLIGQFGVGFYSIYLVADKVRVVTKNNDDDQYVWESSADGVFTIAKDPRGNTLGRGTEITLFLKEESGEFAIQERLEELILRYSEFITFPIYLEKSKTEMMPTQEEIDDMTDDEEDEGAEEEEEVTADKDKAEEEEGEKKKEEPVTVTEWERVNNQVAIWSRSPKDITEDEYGSFYKTISKDYQAPTTWIHFKAEGEMEFKSILFVPSEPAFDLYDTYYTKFAQLRLYVKKVLISDDFEELLPRYMNFIKGVVDSDDLPLNVSRETLQQHKLLKVMGKKLTRKVLEMLRRLASNKGPEDSKDDDNEENDKNDAEGEDSEKYLKFWEQFGKSIKLGVIEDPANRSKLVKLLRFKTSKSEGKWVSLDHYLARAKEWQTSIYYIAGESMEAVKKSPFLEKFIKKDIEVVYLIDAIDEYAIQNVPEYEGRKLQSITKEGLKFGDEDEKTVKSREKYYKEHFKPTVDFFKDLFKGKIKEVQISQRVESAPCVIVTGRYGHSANMERIMRNQAMQDPTKLSMLMSQKTMEINPRHPMIAEINRRLQDDEAQAEKELKDTAWLLYDTALLESGFQHDDVQNFSQRVLKAVKQGLGIKSMELLEEADIPEEEEDDEDALDIEDEDGPGATYTPPGGAPFGAGKSAEPNLNMNFGSDEL